MVKVTFCPYNLPCLEWCALHASAKTLLPKALQRGVRGRGNGGLNLSLLQLMGH